MLIIILVFVVAAYDDDVVAVVVVVVVQYAQTTDAQNAKRREQDRHPIFSVYPPALSSAPHSASSSPFCLPPSLMLDERPPPSVPEQKFGFRFFLKCLSLSFKLKAERNGNLDHVRKFTSVPFCYADSF